jgi:hypothetical protein
MKRALAGICLFLAGCPNKDNHIPVGLEDAPAFSAVSSVPLPVPTPTIPPKNLPCRAIAVTGKVTDVDGGGSLAMGGQLPDSVFELAEGTRMTVKNPQSGREVTFEGAATMRACVAGDPEHWLLRGGFSATPGSGEKPGAEEWLVTPYGILRWSSAMAKVRIEKDRATVRVTSGGVSVYGPKVTTPDGGAPSATGTWIEATSNAPLDLVSPGPPKTLVDACATLAKAARDLGAQVMSPDANLADLAPKHIEARQKARAACALGRAAAASDKALSIRAEAADAEWRIVTR